MSNSPTIPLPQNVVYALHSGAPGVAAWAPLGRAASGRYRSCVAHRPATPARVRIWLTRSADAELGDRAVNRCT